MAPREQVVSKAWQSFERYRDTYGDQTSLEAFCRPGLPSKPDCVLQQSGTRIEWMVL